MGLILGAIHVICLILISVRAEQSEKGRIDYLGFNLLEKPHILAPKGKAGADNGCSCVKSTCSCCAQLDVPHVIDEYVCVNVSYVSADLGLKLDVILNGKVIYSDEISVRDPPPVCIGIPYVKKYAEICLDLYNITWRKHVGGCIKIQIRLLYIIRKDFDLGCFNFNGLDEKSKIAVSHTLFWVKMHQMMVSHVQQKVLDKKSVIV